MISCPVREPHKGAIQFFRSWRSRVAIATTTAATVIAVGAAVFVATSSEPAGGSFHGFGSGGSVLVTGAIGDHGRSQSVNKAGKPSSKGSYEKLTLSKGTLTLNKTKLDKALTKAFKTVTVNKATCSASVSASATILFVNGTGRYAGASGSAHITVADGFILPREAGKCDKRSKPVATKQIVYGTGNVSF